MNRSRRRRAGRGCVFVVWAATLVLLIGVATSARAAPPASSVAVPAPLKPWVPWVLEGQAKHCPTLNGSTDHERCAWPARLALTVDDKAGHFTQRWHIENESWVSLPGDEKRWPQDVSVDGKRVVVLPRDNAPSVLVKPGDHTFTGSFSWDSPPESLQIPPDTGLLSLTLRGTAVAQPAREAGGALYLQKVDSKDESDRLEFVVHRKLTDDVPAELTTRIELNVSGKNREVLLGRALPAGFVPISLDAALPARVEADGRVRIQARPGTYTLTLRARSEGPVGAVQRPDPEGPWRDGEELWVFEARGDLRLVTVEGAASIDPAQTSLPEEWKRLPAYVMKLGDTLRLDERRRGDTDPPADQLAIARTLWLDFDGGGYTITDKVSGALNSDRRLEMEPPTTLGRVDAGGSDLFITRLGAAAPPGVELRRGPLELSADSRLIGNVGDVPAVGWRQDFHQASALLHLPPGWRLFHAAGADDVGSTWLRHWTLLELFLLLVSALTVARLFGLPWGALALVLFALTFPEADAPKWLWPFALAAEALARALPRGRPASVVRWSRALILLTLTLVSIGFLVGHVREALYPMLTNPNASFGENLVTNTAVPQESGGADVSVRSQAVAVDIAKEVSRAGAKTREPNAASMMNPSSKDERQYNMNAYDAKAMVQTGPGLPRWTWTNVDLRWSGPVERNQRVRLWFWSPWVNRALAFVRAALLVLFLARLTPYLRERGPRWWRPTPRAGGPAVIALAIAAALSAPRAARADIPDQATLDELAKRLTARAECAPNCASSSRMSVEATPATLRLRVQVDAADATGVALPTSSQWSPTTVSVDGKESGALARDDGKLWVFLNAGSHQVVLEGPAADRQTVQLSLPLKPHRVESTLDGWTLDGVHEDGLADDDIQLTRVRRGGEKASGLTPSTLPPFVRIERDLQLGLNWQVDTKVTRVSPTGSAVVLEVPLLPGESVTTAEMRVVGGKVLVNMGPQVKEVGWHSVLAESSPIRLRSERGTPAVEVWRVEVSPLWHATFAGVPLVHAGQNERHTPEFRPWPGEEATVTVVRPDGVPGRTLTIDRSVLVLRPGARATDAELTLSLRSSRGGEHTMALPPGAQLSAMRINGTSQALRQDGRNVTFPIVPGQQTVIVSYRDDTHFDLFYRTPSIDLGAPNVNTSIRVESLGRWVLLVGGPRVGPAILFWGLLIVLLVLAYGLARVTWVPLGTAQWALLGVGLSQVSLVAGAFVVAWLLLLGWRQRRPVVGNHVLFDLRQLTIVALTVLALCILFAAVRQGLLDSPEMQIEGNASTGDSLHWFIDRGENVPPRAWVISTPVFVYRLAMLLWALWLARAVLAWLRWGWRAFGTEGYWAKAPPKPRPPVPIVATPAAVSAVVADVPAPAAPPSPPHDDE